MANSNQGMETVFGMIKGVGTMITFFQIAFVILFIAAIIAVTLGLVFKYKESKAIRDAALIKAEADRDAAKLRGAAEVQQAVNRKEDSLTTGLLRAALAKMKPEDAVSLIQGLHTDAQSVGTQSVADYQTAITDDENLNAILDDLMSGLDQNMQQPDVSQMNNLNNI